MLRFVEGIHDRAASVDADRKPNHRRQARHGEVFSTYSILYESYVKSPCVFLTRGSDMQDLACTILHYDLNEIDGTDGNIYEYIPS